MKHKQLVAGLLLYSVCTICLVAQNSLKEQQTAVVSTWNAIGESYSRENLVIDDLTKSMRLNPPWRVVDAREPAKREGLIDRIIEEHKRRIKLFEKLKTTQAEKE